MTVANAQNVRFEVASAVASGNKLTVTAFATNEGVDRNLQIYRYGFGVGAQMIDELGNTYHPVEYFVGNQANGADIVNGVRTRLIFRFKDMPTVAGELEAKQVRRFQAVVQIASSSAVTNSTIEFRVLPITKNQ